MFETNRTDIHQTTDIDSIAAKRAKVSLLSMTESEVLLDADGVAVRAALQDEGALLWELARDAGGIDLNSPYAYLMQCRNFSDTCMVAEVFGTPAGFITAHRIPRRPHVLFVWQVAVLSEFRGLGIARRLLDGLIAQPVCVGVRKLEATVTPSNRASKALFSAFAKAHGAALEFCPGFTADAFPADARHEEERLLTIHPIHPIDCPQRDEELSL
jgi:L-2,4-diaminobutyric acid acetyltransferase